MEDRKIVESYIEFLEKGEIKDLPNLFEEDAVVYSPLYGRCEAKKFYSDLFSDTNNSMITLYNVFKSLEDEDLISCHFEYNWTMKDSSQVKFQCIDLFKLSKERKIRELKIIYDTSGVRRTFDNL